MSIQVTRQKDFVAITVKSGSIMPSLSEAIEIRDKLIELFPPENISDLSGDERRS